MSAAALSQELLHPEWLRALFAVLAAAIAAVLVARFVAGRRRRRLLGVVVLPSPPALRSDAALLLALTAIFVGLLAPRIGERTAFVPGSGVDVVFLVDVSRSMDATDVPPSRLARAQRGVTEILERLGPGDRAALAAFAGRGVLLAPLTPDRKALAGLVASLDTGLVHPASSDLGAGVRAALEAFEATSERPKLVFLLSDGEDRARGRNAGAAEAARAEVKIFAVALGSDAGATVPDHGLALKDSQGNTVVSQRDVSRLERLAEATGGAVFAADDWGVFDFAGAAAAIRRDAGVGPGTLVPRKVRAVRVLPFAAAAFLLLLLEGLPRARPRPAGAGRKRATAATAAAAALLLGAGDADAPEVDTLESRVRETPRDASLLVELGILRLDRGDADGAARAFLAAGLRGEDARTASTGYYDLGVAALTAGDLPRARDAFFDALALDPELGRARFNLEWTLRTLETADPPSLATSSEADSEEQSDEEQEEERVDAEPPAMERPSSSPDPVELSEAEQQRWLDRLQDDPTRALRGAAQQEGRRGASGPAW